MSALEMPNGGTAGVRLQLPSFTVWCPATGTRTRTAP